MVDEVHWYGLSPYHSQYMPAATSPTATASDTNLRHHSSSQAQVQKG